MDGTTAVKKPPVTLSHFPTPQLPGCRGVVRTGEVSPSPFQLASVDLRCLPLFGLSHKMLDVRVLPVANTHSKPEQQQGKERIMK